jgi:aminoglycoside phosphotransferase (APT) family kinase protein
VTDALHADELTVDPATVRALVDREVPEYAHLPLTRLAASGSTNSLYRLGEDLLVRLPRQPGGGAAIAKEARWSPLVTQGFPVPTPEIVAVGEPGFGYPEHWSVVRWLDGEHPAVVDPTEPAAGDRGPLAAGLADVLVALRTATIPPEAMADPALRWYRGEPLVSRDEPTRRHFAECRAIDGLGLDLDAAERFWDRAMRLPGIDRAAPPSWYHGDLLAENLLVADGRLTGVLDFGSLSIGDPTIDLHGAWEILDPAGRDVLRERAGIDEPTWLRGRAWALSIAVMTFPYYWRTMPQRCASRLAMARAVLADDQG